MTFAIGKPMTRVRRLQIIEAPRRPARRLPGGWVTDLATLGKALVLCDFCAHKFAPKRYGYVRKRVVAGSKYVLGECDGCKRHSQATLFLKEN